MAENKVLRNNEEVKTNKPFINNRQRETEVLIIVILLSSFYLYAIGIIPLIQSRWPARTVNALVCIGLALPALVGYKLKGRKLRDIIHIDMKSILTALCLCAAAFFVNSVILTISGQRIHLPFYIIWEQFLWGCLHFILFVGTSEEFLFREYIQDSFDSVLGRLNFLSPVFAGLIFGLVHFINGDINQVVLSFSLGMILGYARKYIKSCDFWSIAIAHGLYDILITFFWS